jgi:hypothetical protein
MDMQRSDRKEQEVLESIKALLSHLSLGTQGTPVCARCRTATQYRDAKVWLYGTESQWILRLPTCVCDLSGSVQIEAAKTSKETSTTSGFATNNVAWRDRYHAALFEPNRSKILQKIAEAETAIIQRARELFRSSGHSAAERRALDASLDALRALRCSTGIWRTTEKMTNQ